MCDSYSKNLGIYFYAYPKALKSCTGFLCAFYFHPHFLTRYTYKRGMHSFSANERKQKAVDHLQCRFLYSLVTIRNFIPAIRKDIVRLKSPVHTTLNEAHTQ